jgi:selenocysteine-specific elongation factor
VASLLARDGAAPRAQLLINSRFSSAEITAALESLANEGKIILLGPLAADAPWWRQLRESAIRAIDLEHRTHPERLGLAVSDLRASLQKHATPEVFEALITDLCRTGFAQIGVAIRRATHRPVLPPHLQAAGAQVRSALSAKPLEPPSKKELAPDSSTQQALRFLVQTGEATELNEDIVILTDQYFRVIDIVRQHLRDHGPATASELRQAVGTSRRILIPLLERLDKEGITRREGDKRFLKANPPSQS